MYHSTEYRNEFWNAMKDKPVTHSHIDSGRNRMKNSYRLPHEENKKFTEARKKENVFRQIATVVSAPGDQTVWTFDNELVASWIDRTNPQFFEQLETYDQHAMKSCELGAAILVPEDFAQGTDFDVEGHITKEFARIIGRVEEDAFVNGTGENQPRGFLQDALVGCYTPEITFDDVLSLFFTQEKEYRKNGVRMMSEEIAYKLRTLTDDSGNYLWNQHDNTILGKLVIISEYMPLFEEAGSRLIAFGDFSFYWIVDRMPFVMRRLDELFAISQQVGFLGYEFLDAKLIKPEAIRVLEIRK